MAIRENAPYNQSRAALRQLYGSRRIDASAPQSARDSTPSGEIARRVQAGASEAEANQMAGRSFAQKFSSDPAAGPAPANVRPLDLMRQRQPPQSPLEAIQQAQDNGAVAGVFGTPYGDVGFRRPSLMPETAISGIEDYLGMMPGTTASSSSLFPLRKAQKPSILDGASKWLQPL